MDYGFAHAGKVYTPNGTAGIPPAENTTRNQAIERAELASWKGQPDRQLAYFTFPTETAPVCDRANWRQWRHDFHPDLQGATIATWLGTSLGRITSAHVYRHNFGGRFIALTVQGTNGATYHGRASYDWGQCVVLRKGRTA